MNAHAIATVDAEPSRRLRFVAGYFTVTGVLSSLSLVFIVALTLFGNSAELAAAAAGGWWRLAPLPLAIASQFWTASALRDKRRAGWYGAVAALGVPLAIMASQPPLNWGSIIPSAIGLLLLVSVRKELE